MPDIDLYSASAVPLEMYFNQTNLSQGTGFIWQVDAEFFLITNWHNLSGKNPLTCKHLSPTLAEPNAVRVWWNLRNNLGRKGAIDYPIRDSGDLPLWFVHPVHGKKVDVVALPLLPPDDADPHPINTMPQLDLLTTIGMDVYVLGYPFGMVQSGGLPIWKRASLASEPAVAGTAGAELNMLLDTASRPGMSGSPIIQRSWGTTMMANGDVAVVTGAATKFVGVYSGRIQGSDPIDAQLGIGWPPFFVTDIISGKRRDDH
ncbi:trypsin-like peptidase domain-containing protein [Mesorhizobium sp. VK4C]|uniref:trypsin-like peptidase domain-containing protein n=1 Tax=Mesorhizobium captivum TaxID=3072319 RepID=UPI002A244AFE|nr:trypsin-like peptidase domain-containing protein [Mesorhizobium sp. VK4C]MDX8499876.1 trypsin-like peptidase domain-containing protein [Mesorhizobium sp. VK4C]